MGTWCIHLLGGLALTCDGASLPPIPSTSARSLLAYLLAYRDQPHTRDLLAGTFWPDLPDATARRRLSQALWQIRRALDPHAILLAEGGTVQINPNLPLWIDVEEFGKLGNWEIGRLVGSPNLPISPLTNLPDLGKAVELYRGDFLAGYYDDWLLAERERLREMFLAALERLVASHKGRGEYERALAYARRLAGEDPWREEAHCEVMRLCHLLGRDAEALKQFDTCCRILKDELAALPEPETVALAQEIARHAALEAAPYLPQAAPFPLRRAEASTEQPGDAGPVQVPLVGRQEERAALVSHLEAAVNGLGGLVLVEGEAGVGKTRLLQELARDAGWRDVQVLWGHGRETAGIAPFAPWVEALQSDLSPLRLEQWAQLVEPIWLQVLRPLLPGLAAVAPNPAPPLEPERERERLVNAFAQLLAAWGRVMPLVLILEDLHWAGEDSLEVLAALSRRLPAHKVLVVGSYRGDEARARPGVWEQVQALHRAGLSGWLRIDPLGAGASGELIRRSLGSGQTAPLFEARLYRETGGNPLFILEILRSLYDEGLLFRDAEGRWSTPWDETTVAYAELRLPPVVEQVIARRLAQLAPAERAVLETAAVLGGGFDFHLLQATSDQAADRLLPALHALVHRHFLVEQPAAYEFGHDQIRQVVYRSLAAKERQTMHRRVAVALEALHPDQAAALAHHFSQGEVWDRAVEAYAAAGRAAAAVYATEAALHAYGQALTILQTYRPFPPDRVERLHFDLLAARCPLLHLRGEREMLQADVETMLALARTPGEPERQVKALLQKAGFLAESTSQYEAARQAAEEALALARQHGLHQHEAPAWLTIGTAWKQQGHNQPALEAYQRALAARQASPVTEGSEVEIHVCLVMTYRDMGDLERAQEAAQIALEKAQAHNEPLAVARVHNALAWITRARGDHRAEAEHCRAMLAQMRAIGHRYYEGVALNNLSLAHSALGEHGPAIEAAEQALDLFRQIDHRHGQVILLLNLSSRYKSTGQLAQARRVLAEGLPLARELALADDEARILSSLAELLTHAGEYEAAEEALGRADEITRDLGSSYLQATVHYRAGELCLARGDYGRAGQLFDQALREYEASGYAYYQTLMRSFLAATRYCQGDWAGAVTLSSQALAEMDSRPDSPLILEACLHHYQIMAAAGQAEAARAALERAYTQVQERRAALPDPAWQRGFVQDVPLHREIVAAREALQPRHLTVRLPRAEAPLGRALRDDEYVTVTWTVEAPDDAALPGKAARRRHQLLRLLAEAQGQGAAPRDEDLAEALGVGLRTLRRDIAALRAGGHDLPTRWRLRRLAT
jgi:DNA-binding SARP family transcriptional activator